MVRAICEAGGFASRARGTLPNRALQRTALRAAAERQYRWTDRADEVNRMLRRVLRFAALCGATLAIGCGGTGSSVTNCPSYLVVPDAGVSGFSTVGEWRTDAVCAQYCETDYPVCQLVSATSVKCQKGCA